MFRRRCFFELRRRGGGRWRAGGFGFGLEVLTSDIQSLDRHMMVTRIMCQYHSDFVFDCAGTCNRY